MRLLNIFKAPEFKLSDKKFEKLNMQEARMTQWICLENPESIKHLMSYAFGPQWHLLPFKSASEILHFRFGDYFVHPEEPFNYDSWNSLLFLMQNLNEAQKRFLVNHNFLPHKYVSMKEEEQLLNQEIKQLNILLQELLDSNSVEQHKVQTEVLQEKQSRSLALQEKIATWEKENPNGGNPADAKEYLYDELELKEWLINNQHAAQYKSQMFTIMRQQMIAALQQARKGQRFPYEDFGHQEELFRRRGKTNNTTFATKTTYSSHRTNTQKANQFQGKPLATNKVAKSTKLKETKTIDHTEKEAVVEVKPQEVKFSEILKSQQEKQLVVDEDSNAKERIQDYTTTRSRIAQEILENKKHTTNQTNDVKTIIGVVLAVITIVGICVYLFW